MDLREVHDGRTYTTRLQRSCCLFRNSLKRGGDGNGHIVFRHEATWRDEPYPEVTTRGRSETASLEPSASMARLSTSQFTANFEKS
jgi:hypothetical protein